MHGRRRCAILPFRRGAPLYSIGRIAGNDKENGIPQLVRQRDARKLRARPRRRRVHLARPEAHRGIAQVLGGSQHAPQSPALPLRHVHAGVLHQPSGEEPRRGPEAHPGTGEGRVAGAVWQAIGILCPN